MELAGKARKKVRPGGGTDQGGGDDDGGLPNPDVDGSVNP